MKVVSPIIAMRNLRVVGLALALAAPALDYARAQETVKIGLVLPMSGALASVGRQANAGAKLYMQQKGDSVAGKKIELVLRDDGSAPDKARASAQELIVNNKVTFLGVGTTPSAIAIAPLSTEAKIVTVVVASTLAGINQRSPYFVGTGSTIGQQASVVADWAAKNGGKTAAIIQSDTVAGAEAAAFFNFSFTGAGGKIVQTIRTPPASNDFSASLQTARAEKPDTLFAFVPPAQIETLARQFRDLGLDKDRTRLVAPGAIADDDQIARTGEALLGLITAGPYSVLHDSPLNKEFVAAFRRENNFRPNIVSVAAYDGMHLMYEALRKTNGNTDSDALIAAMKGMKWESPRGPIEITAETRDIIQTIYVRRIDKVQDEFGNVEIAAFPGISSQPPACCVPKTCPDMKVCGQQ